MTFCKCECLEEFIVTVVIDPIFARIDAWPGLMIVMCIF